MAGNLNCHGFTFLMKQIIKLNKILTERAAGLGVYRRVAILFTSSVTLYWLYIVFTISMIPLKPTKDASQTIMNCLLFVIVFDLILISIRLEHNSLVRLDCLTIFPVKSLRKACYLLTTVVIDIKILIYFASALCMIAFFLFKGYVISSVLILLIFSIAYFVVCLWETVIILFFYRLLYKKQTSYAQWLVSVWLLLLILFISYLPTDVILQVPFVSYFYQALMNVFQYQLSKALLNVINLIIDIIPALFLIFLLVAGGLPVNQRQKYFSFSQTDKSAVASSSNGESS